MDQRTFNQIASALFACVLVTLSQNAFSNVRFYKDANCTGSYKSVAHTGYSDLTSVYYTGTTISMNNSVSSIYIEGGWEVLTCNLVGYETCAAQMNSDLHLNLGQFAYFEDWCYNLPTKSWNSSDPIPPNNAITSFYVQPKNFESYWQTYAFQEDPANSQTGRRGFVELWSLPNFQGKNYKIYYSATNLTGSPIGFNTQSIRIHGNLGVNVCTATDNCVTKVTFLEDQLDLTVTALGVQTFATTHGSAMVMHPSDLDGSQTDDFLASFLSKAPETSVRKSYFRWAEDGYGTTHVKPDWPAGCYEKCTNANPDWTCSSDYACCEFCKANQHSYVERANRSRWAGDSKIAFINGHGNFRAPIDGLDPAANMDLVSRTSWSVPASGSLNIHTDDFLSQDGIAHDDVAWEWVVNPEWGLGNTDWIITVACNSLGKSSLLPYPDPPYGNSLEGLGNWIPWAWKSYLLSGVHGIGGFFNDSHWRDMPWDRDGDDIAEDFWSDLQTMPFSMAWGGIAEQFDFPTDTDRNVYFLSTCLTSDQYCWPRTFTDYYWGYQSGPQPDLHGQTDLKWYLQEYVSY